MAFEAGPGEPPARPVDSGQPPRKAAGLPEPATPADAQGHRLHPITPWRRAWAVLAGVAALLFHDPHQARQWSEQLTPGRVLLGFAVLIPVAFSYGFASWWFTRYQITETELRVHTGVVFRRTKHLRIDRLQSIDITRPLLGRLAGVAKLQLDLAGGKDELAYLTERDARDLRAELLARAAGIAPDSGEAPQRELVRVPPRALAGSIMLGFGTWSLVAGALVAALLPALLTGRWLFVLFALPAGASLWRVSFGVYAREFGWTVAESPDGLRLDYGLLDRQHETVPPGRVQALRLQQPVLWRLPGWVRLHMAVAGERNDVLLPVAPRQVALGMVARIFPGVDLAAVPLSPAPRRARLRAPLHSRVMACGADQVVFVVRHGLITRIVDIVPHAKVQSVRLSQGPWQRWLGLSSLHLDTAAGQSVTARHRMFAEAHAMVYDQAERSRTGRRTARPERWMTSDPAPGTR